MKSAEQISAISALPVDFIGIIFYPASPRYVEDDFKLATRLKQNITGVFVNAPVHHVLDKIKAVPLDAVQLHGEETTAYCRALKKQGVIVIKAFPVVAGFNFDRLTPYCECTDYFLFDTRSPLKGGSGKKFDWTLLKNYSLNHPFFLSGGIAPEDLNTIQQLRLNKLFGIDINSRFEKAPADKDIEKVKHFAEQLKANKDGFI